VHGWLGIEGAGMAYPDNWRILELESEHFLERLYERDETGAHCGGCPWGNAWKDGYSCRSVMMATQNVCNALETVTMNIDIVIPEMIELERLIEDSTASRPVMSAEDRFELLRPSIMEVFRRSAPPEPNFFPKSALRPQTKEVILQMIRAISSGKKAALFCQFRLVGK